MNRLAVAILAVLALTMAPTALAQSSASYRVSDYAFNSGGHPQQGTSLASAGYRIRLDAIGDGSPAPSLGSATYRLAGGMVSCYPPPGEVAGLRFTDNETLVWDPERSAGIYNLYRDLVGDLATLGYGQCEQPDLAGETTTDNDLPGNGQAFFYLITAENMLTEEGTRGTDSVGADRGQADACP
jgi:hypothetical protein